MHHWHEYPASYLLCVGLLPDLHIFHLWLITYAYLSFRSQLKYHLISLPSTLYYVLYFLSPLLNYEILEIREGV